MAAMFQTMSDFYHWLVWSENMTWGAKESGSTVVTKLTLPWRYRASQSALNLSASSWVLCGTCNGPCCPTCLHSVRLLVHLCSALLSPLMDVQPSLWCHFLPTAWTFLEYFLVVINHSNHCCLIHYLAISVVCTDHLLCGALENIWQSYCII